MTDAHQRTSIEGCYAAGDIVTGLNQLGVAMAQGEIERLSTFTTASGPDRGCAWLEASRCQTRPASVR